MTRDSLRCLTSNKLTLIKQYEISQMDILYKGIIKSIPEYEKSSYLKNYMKHCGIKDSLNRPILKFISAQITLYNII